MDSSNFLSSVKMSELEGIFSYFKGVLFGDSLDWFNHTWIDFMLDTSELSLAVLTDNYNIHILMTGLDSWECEWRCHISE